MAPSSILPDPDTGAPDIYQIWCLRYGRIAKRRVHDNFVFRDMHDGAMPLDLYVWIVRNAHRTILVDTGFRFRAGPQQRHADGTRRDGARPGATRIRRQLFLCERSAPRPLCADRRCAGDPALLYPTDGVWPAAQSNGSFQATIRRFAGSILGTCSATSKSSLSTSTPCRTM
jgi:hypothetical protein